MKEVAWYECVYNRNSKDFKVSNTRTAYGRYLKLLKTIPSGSGRDAVPREFQNLEWLN